VGSVCHRGSAFSFSGAGGANLMLQLGRGLSPRIGHATCFYHATRESLLQLGRGLSPRIGSCRPRPMHLPASRFNWAAVYHRGSALSLRTLKQQASASIGPRSITADREVARPGLLLVAEASIGPRSITADRNPSFRIAFTFTMLQLGRGLSPRIGGKGWGGSPAPLIASIGPRSITADRLLFGQSGGHLAGASIGPRSITADRGFESSAGKSTGWRFNWAAVYHRGSGSTWLTPFRLQKLLQLGRGLSPRIGGRRLCLDQRLYPASIGPRSITADR